MPRRRSRGKYPRDYYYVSNDPAENADNNDPNWAQLRELNTDEERYLAIRKRWGDTIPDPLINLTYRHTNKKFDSESKENHFNPPNNNNNKKILKTRNKLVSRRRSRSCTGRYEKLILDIHLNYAEEYYNLMWKHKKELKNMIQSQANRALTVLQSCIHNYNYNSSNVFRDDLLLQQNREISNLLSHQSAEVQSFLGEKNENIKICQRYMEEVKAFFTFYQKINDDEVTLQMTDEQYEHTTETERMYSLYSKFYN